MSSGSSRADQIADHDGQVAALGSSHGGVVARWPIHFAPGGCAERVPTHGLDRLDEAFPVAQRHPELFKIAFGQLRQHIKDDSVLDECWLILSESQVSQPAANVHGIALIPCQTRERTVANPRCAAE